MLGKSVDVAGMIRALEGFLEAATPAPPPAPPRAKTEVESRLEKLIDELSRPPEPEPEPRPALSVDIQIPPELDELPVPILEEQILSSDLPVPQPEPNEPLIEPFDPAETASHGVEGPAAPQAPPILPRAPSSFGWPRKFAVAFALVAVGALLVRRAPELRPSARRVPMNRPIESTAQGPEKVAAATPAAAASSDPRAKAIALVLAYRPSGGPIACGEIFRSIAGNPLPANAWDLQDLGGGRFAARFSPYTGALAESNSYRFQVDARAGRVRPEADTAERLRADAIGRLAARSNLQAFWQFLDLSR